jgi:uncharacterized protein
LPVTADTNIYVSALQYGGQARRFLDMAREGAFELCISAPILNEMSRVLKEKFGWSEEAIQDAREMIASFTVMVEPAQRLDVVKQDPTDNRILAGSRCVVSGDKHLLHIGRHEGVEILKVSDFLNRQQGVRIPLPPPLRHRACDQWPRLRRTGSPRRPWLNSEPCGRCVISPLPQRQVQRYRCSPGA